MLDLIPTLDPRDAFYTVIGLALFGLTLQPALGKYRIFNLPLFYVLVGTLFGGIAMAVISPTDGGLQSIVIEHASELIVIISLAGAGLAIDTVGTWRSWNGAWRLLAVTMPLTIVGVYLLGDHWLGLTVPGALLLAAVLAPTDPVLARSVQVAPPGQDEDAMEVALTAEAGMNDGLAFPFVYLAIHAATYGVAQATTGEAWLWGWLSFDLAYRVVMGIAMGWIVGWGFAKLVLSPLGDGGQGAWNAVVNILAITLLAYGITEAVDGYGFLAAFFAARAGRAVSRGTDKDSYTKFVHHGADQLEAILLALLLLWLGTFIGSGALAAIAWPEVAFALVVIFVLRPLAGMVALVGMEGTRFQKLAVAFFGIRGMGSVFYLAYAQNSAEFADIDALWRIVAVTILLSILIHGYAANVFLSGDDDDTIGEVHPSHDHEDAVDDGHGDHPRPKAAE